MSAKTKNKTNAKDTKQSYVNNTKTQQDVKTQQKMKQCQRKTENEMTDYEKRLKQINDNQFSNSQLQVKLTPKFYQMMRTMVNSRQSEVGGMIAGYRDGTIFICTNIYIPKQKVTHSDVDYDTDDVDNITMEAWANEEEFIGQVHSHANMGVMWSGIDKDTIEKLRAHMNVPVVSIVTNHNGDILTRIDYKVETPFGYAFVEADEVHTSILMDDYSKDCEQIKKRVEEKTESNTSTMNVYNQGVYGTGVYGNVFYGAYGQYSRSLSTLEMYEDLDGLKETLENLKTCRLLEQVIPKSDIDNLRKEMGLEKSQMSDVDVILEYLEDSDDWELYMEIWDAIDIIMESHDDYDDYDLKTSGRYNQGR